MTPVVVFSDDSAEFNQVNVALLSIFKIEAKGQTQQTHAILMPALGNVLILSR